MATKTPAHVRYGKTLRCYTNRNRESLWFETLGAPYFLAGWKYQYSSETERTLAGRSSRLPDWVGVEILMILLGSLYFAKLSFSEVGGYFLFFFFCIRPLRLPGAVPNRRYRLKIYCKEFLRLLFWQRLRLLDW